MNSKALKNIKKIDKSRKKRVLFINPKRRKGDITSKKFPEKSSFHSKEWGLIEDFSESEIFRLLKYHTLKCVVSSIST